MCKQADQQRSNLQIIRLSQPAFVAAFALLAFFA
jgi:hypothetical protein